MNKMGFNIRIPKFEFDYTLELKKDLINLGIKDIFNEYLEDFSKMIDVEIFDGNLYISDSIHKANIVLSENGINVLSVTSSLGFSLSSLNLKANPVNIVINKPFLFIIRNKNTKDIWFTGTLYEPISWDENNMNKH